MIDDKFQNHVKRYRIELIFGMRGQCIIQNSFLMSEFEFDYYLINYSYWLTYCQNHVKRYGIELIFGI